MKLPLEERVLIVNSLLTFDKWHCTYWSRDDQVEATAEGWSLAIYAQRERQDRIHLWHPPHLQVPESWCEFADDDAAIAHVVKRAEEGSPLHCRALVLHMSSVLKYGK